MPAEKFYIQTFTVEGKLSFPVDMLRYDTCVPDTSEDAVTIAASFECYAPGEPQTFRVRLRRFATNKNNGPTNERWQSFGWQVIMTLK